ncbi:hypothetical protein ABKN59_006595 [Abortiporus biennis]
MFSVLKSRRVLKVQERFAQLTGPKRAQSPPSPASFVSPEYTENHEKEPATTLDNNANVSDASLVRLPSPRVQLDFSSDSMFEWFPSELLRGESSTNVNLPERNVSLPSAHGVRGKGSTEALNAMAGPSKLPNDSREALNGGSGVTRGHDIVHIRNPSTDKAQRRHEVFNIRPDEIIVIEAERPLNQPREDLDGDSEAEPESKPDSADDEGPSLQPIRIEAPIPLRRPMPAPIKIPSNPVHNKVRITRSSSLDGATLPHPRLPSRPESAYSDDLSSVSGTTLARQIVAGSFIVSNDSRSSRFKYGIGRQDSATLPRGENPFANSPYWRDKRISGGEVVISPEFALGSPIPPVPPIPSSAELSALGLNSSGMGSGASSFRSSLVRHSSTLGIPEVLNKLEGKGVEEIEEEKRLSAGSDEEYKNGHKRTRSLTRLPKEQLAMKRFSKISEHSSPAPSPTTPAILIGSPKTDRSSSSSALAGKRLDRMSASNHTRRETATQSSSTNDGDVSSLAPSHSEDKNNGGNSRSNSQNEDNATDVDMSQTPQHSAQYTGSTSDGSTPMSGNASSSKSPASTASLVTPHSVYRSLSESGTPRSTGNRPSPMVLVPFGMDRPRSVQLTSSASPLSSTQDDMRHKLPFRPLASGVPQTARLSTPIDSPDILDQFEFPVSRSNVVRQLSRNGTRRGGVGAGQPPQPITVPSAVGDIISPLQHSSSTDSPDDALAQQTFPETPYAFSPLVSAGFPPVPPAKSSGKLRSFNRGRGPRFAARHLPKSPSVGSATSMLASFQFANLRSAGLPTTPMTPPLSSAEDLLSNVDNGKTDAPQGGEDSHHDDQEEEKKRVLSAIEEMSNPATPQSNATSSPDPQTTIHAPIPISSIPAAALELAASSSPETTTQPLDASIESSSIRSSLSNPSRRTSSFSISHYQEVSPAVVPQKRSLTPLPSPPPSNPTSSPSLSTRTNHAPPSPSQSFQSHAPSQAEELRSLIEESPRADNNIPLPPYAYEHPPSSPLPPVQEALPSPPPYLLTAASSMNSVPPPTLQRPPPLTISSYHTTEYSQPAASHSTASSTSPIPSKRFPRSRPPPPSGPRRPSQSNHLMAQNRARNGSVSSMTSTHTIHMGGAGPSTYSRATPSSASSPRFHTNAIKFRGLTMEAAQWTFTSQQLQEVVSKAIKQSADASAIRLLPIDQLSEAIPEEVQRLQSVAAELKTNYKLSVRKRRQLLHSLGSVTDGGLDPVAAMRLVEEMSDVSEHLDHITEQLHDVMDQLCQLQHIQDLHSSSALAMALRKLNTSLIKQLAQNTSLREQMSQLEAERDEAWQQAQEVAQEFDDLQEKACESGVQTPNSASRRQSRISIARKTSIRATKAGLRSPSRHRSQRSSAASSAHRSSMVSSPPGVRASGEELIPPVPRLPKPSPLGIVTDLPDRSAGIGSGEMTPNSEVRAMIDAQKELCDMLGISLEELQGGGSLPKRRLSTSAAIKSPQTPKTRRNSEVISPNQTGYNQDPRSAVLAAIGMVSHDGYY